jgi:hypothetical protein
MALSFPSNPTNGQVFASGVKSWVFSTTTGLWSARALTAVVGSTTGTVSVTNYTDGVTTWDVYSFTSGSGSITFSQPGKADVLVVGAGGGSNLSFNAGGGGGQVLEVFDLAVTGTTYSVTVGAGQVSPTNGSPSAFGVLQAIGGGAGGNGTAGYKGATGGGGSSGFAGGTSLLVGGFSGGSGTGGWMGSGAGAGGAGVNATSGNVDGGIGVASSIRTGSAVYYAGGGGGTATTTFARTATATAGAANSGSGAGNGQQFSSLAGGSGLVVVRVAR